MSAAFMDFMNMMFTVGLQSPGLRSHGMTGWSLKSTHRSFLVVLLSEIRGYPF